MSTVQEREVLKEFIEVYRDNPCLWDMSSELYRNKEMKHAAWGQLTLTLQKLDPDANLCTTKKKVENLRAVYFRELRKVRASEQTATDQSDIFVPNLWYFKLISFLDNKEWSLRTRQESLDSTDPLQECHFKQPPTSEEESMESTHTEILLELTPDILPLKRRTISSDQGKPKVKRKSELTQTFVELNNRNIPEPKYETTKNSNSFGIYIGEQLDKTSTFQRHVAEKLISEVLFLAKTENLNYDSKIETASKQCSNCQPEHIVSSPKKITENIEEDSCERTILKELLTEGRQK